MLKLAYRYVKENKRNSIICIIGIALSMTLVFSMIQTAGQIIYNYKSMILAQSNYDVRIGSSRDEEEPLDETCFHEIMDLYRDRYDLVGAINIGQVKKSEVSGYRVAGMSGDWPTLLETELLDGNIPSAVNDVCIEESLAKERELQVGMPLTLQLYDNRGKGAEMEYEFRISGIISNTSGGYIITTLDTASRILAEDEYKNAVPVNHIFISIDKLDYPEEDIMDIYTELAQKYEMPFVKHIYVNNEKEQIGLEKGSYYTLSHALYGIVCFLLVVMGIFVYYMMRVNLLSKIRQYGILRGIGMDRRRLAMLIICEVLIYTVVGVVLGCLGGILLNRLMQKIILKGLIGEYVGDSNYSIGVFIAAIGLAIAAVILASLRIFVEIVNKKPIELLQNYIKNKNGHYIACRNVVLELAWNNAHRNKGKTRALLLTMVLSVLLVVLLGNGMGSIDFNMKKGATSFANIEVFAVRGAGTSYISDEDFEKLKEIEDAQLYWQAGLFEYNIHEEVEEQNYTTVVIYSSNLMEKFRQANSLKDEDIVLCYKEDLDIPKNMVLYDGDEPVAELRPQAQIPESVTDLRGEGIPRSRHIIIIDEQYAESFMKNSIQVSDVYLHSDNLTAGDVSRILENGYYVYSDLADFMKEAEEQLKSMLVLVAYMMVSMITLAVFMITCTVKENFEHRRREIGMMRAVGGTRHMLSRIMCSEILMSMIAAALLASVIAAPVSVYVYYIIKGKIGMAWQGYALGIPIILIGSMLLVEWNVYNCMKCSTVELLRSDE